MKDFGDMVDKFYSQAMHVGKREGKDMALLLCLLLSYNMGSASLLLLSLFFFPQKFCGSVKKKMNCTKIQTRIKSIELAWP